MRVSKGAREMTQIANRPRAATNGHSGANAVTVVVVHREGAAREEIRAGLEQGGLTLVGMAHHAAQGMYLVGQHRPMVCLVERELKDSRHLLERIHASFPSVRIVVLGSSASRGDIMENVRAGADGYLPASIALPRLCEALRAVARGEPALPRRFTTNLVAEVRTSKPERSHRLRDTFLYPFRFYRHYRHRRRAKLPVATAWASTRKRMQLYGR
jgi:DNA-binding NarL/FixJ family response regulator